MILGALPQNQLNALPLITASEAIAPATVSVVGNKITKFWGPAQTGVAAVNFSADPDEVGAALLLTAFLDFSGCSEFVVILNINITAAGGLEAGAAVSLFAQYRATGTAGVQPRTGNLGTTYYTQLQQRTPGYGTLTAPFTVPVMFGWSNATSTGVATGTDCRLWFRRTAAIRANQLYSVYVWAGQS